LGSTVEVGEGLGRTACPDEVSGTARSSNTEKRGTNNLSKLSPRITHTGIRLISKDRKTIHEIPPNPMNGKPILRAGFVWIRGSFKSFGNEQRRRVNSSAQTVTSLRHDVALPASQVQPNAPGSNFNFSIFAGFG
jgi:hypothetical protein